MVNKLGTVGSVGQGAVTAEAVLATLDLLRFSLAVGVDVIN
jgi:hypothetical protein